MAKKEELTTLSAHDPLINTQCLACEENFKEGDEVVLCPRCKTPHHIQCWTEAAGCKKHGCPQVAVTFRVEPRDNLGDSRYLKRSPKQTALMVVGIVLALAAVVFAMRPGPDPAQGRTKLSLMVPGGISETAFFDEFALEYNESFPEHYLLSSVTPSIAYDQKLVVLLGARDAPDIFSLQEDRYPMFAEMGGLLDLKPFLQNSPELTQAVFPDGTEDYEIHGGIYGLPHPGRNEFYSIWALSPHPHLAWGLMEELFIKILNDWPEELNWDIPSGPGAMPMPLGF